MKEVTIIFWGILVFVSGCHKNQNQEILRKQSVIIAGRIYSVKSETVSIAFQDIIRGSAHFTQILDPANGTFHFKFDIYHAQDVRLSYNDKYLRLIIEPSDSLFITFTSKDFDKDPDNKFFPVKFSGNNKLINEEVEKFSNFSKMPDFNPNCNGKPVNEYLSELEKQIANENKELNEFISIYRPTARFVEWAKNDIIYTIANYLISYKAYLFYNNLPRNDNLFNTDIFPINNEESLVSSMFGLHLWHYAADKYIQNDSSIMNYLKNENYLDAYKKCIGNVLKNEPEGIIRDIMVYKLLSSLFDESFDGFKTIWNDKTKLLTNRLLITELDYRTIQTENAENYGIAFLNDFSKKESEFFGDIFKEILNESKDKLVYLDIWATWCGPCRSQIPHIIELHNKLRNENIEFIALCCNSDRILWRNMINENKIPGKHYFLDKAQSDLLRTRLKFDGFPTYMIIRDGVIINKKAPRPSRLPSYHTIASKIS